MALDDWPTLSYFMLTGKSIVAFLNYKADQAEVPYILNQFSQMWETRYSPTDRSFPCFIQRPPSLSEEAAKDR